MTLLIAKRACLVYLYNVDLKIFGANQTFIFLDVRKSNSSENCNNFIRYRYSQILIKTVFLLKGQNNIFSIRNPRLVGSSLDYFIFLENNYQEKVLIDFLDTEYF